MQIEPHPQRAGAYLLTAESVVPQSIEGVFSYFSNAHNLEELTPAWLNFEVLQATPEEMGEGTLIDYRLRLYGIPLRWQSRITNWDPPHCFVDEQIRGPYKRWRHEHRFESVDGGTRCRDVVEYEVPGGWLIHRLLVRRDLERIFGFRQQKFRELFAPQSPPT